MRWGLVCAAAVSLGLSGCGTLSEQFAPPRTISLWDSAAFDRDAERLSRHAETLSDAEALLNSGLVGTTQSADDRYVFQWSLATERTSTQDGEAQESDRQRLSYRLVPYDARIDGSRHEEITPTIYQRLLRQHVRDRVRQINTACLGYFSNLESLSSGSRFTREAAGVFANYASVLIGLATDAGATLAVLAGTRAAFDSTMSAAEDLLLLNPSPMQTYQLVVAEHRERLAATRIDTLTLYTDAAPLIEGYAYDCTPLGIRRAIGEAVEQRSRASNPGLNTTPGLALLNQIAALIDSRDDTDDSNRIGQLGARDAAYLSIVLDQWDCQGNACSPTLGRLVQDAKGRGTTDVVVGLLDKTDTRLDAAARRQIANLLQSVALVQPSFLVIRSQIEERIARELEAERQRQEAEQLAAAATRQQDAQTESNTSNQQPPEVPPAQQVAPPPAGTPPGEPEPGSEPDEID